MLQSYKIFPYARIYIQRTTYMHLIIKYCVYMRVFNAFTMYYYLLQ
nr:MAG TPA: hypothetical protein [Caudoviricetes sp.]